jgi:predicted peroxiredoxin
MMALGVMIIGDSHERAHAALILATGAAAIGRPVVIFATQSGCHLFEAAAPLEKDPRETRLAERGVAGIGTLLAAADDLGIRRIACEAGLRAEAIPPEALQPGIEVAGIVTFLAAIGQGPITTF